MEKNKLYDGVIRTMHYDYGWSGLDKLPDQYKDLLNDTINATTELSERQTTAEASKNIDIKQLNIADVSVSLPEKLECPKCKKQLKYADGYNSNPENCDDPNYICKCGFKIYLDTPSRQ